MTNNAIAILEKRIVLKRGSEIRITYEFSENNKIRCLQIREWYMDEDTWRATKRGVRIPQRQIMQFQDQFAQAANNATAFDSSLS